MTISISIKPDTHVFVVHVTVRAVVDTKTHLHLLSQVAHELFLFQAKDEQIACVYRFSRMNAVFNAQIHGLWMTWISGLSWLRGPMVLILKGSIEHNFLFKGCNEP